MRAPGEHVFGRKGKITVTLANPSAKRGEAFEGQVLLNLKKPVEARELRIGLMAERKVRRRGADGKMQTRTEEVWSYAQPLDGEKTYPEGASGPYDFKLVVPQEKERQAEGAVGAVLDTVQTIVELGNAPLKWYVTAELDVPKKLDVSKRVQVIVV